MVKKIYSKIRYYCPLPVLIIYALFLLCLMLHLISANSVLFSDFFNRYISSYGRNFLAKLTNVFPFSISETIIIFLPVIITLLITGSIYINKKSVQAGVRYLCWLFAVVTLFYSIFVLNFAMAYQGSTLEEKLNLNRRNVSPEQLYETAVILNEKVTELSDNVNFKLASFSVMPYSLNTMNTKLNDIYNSVTDKYKFIGKLRSNLKYVLLSEPMTYTHISGVYTFYTGEANININFPDYTIPYTAAHELSHQRGVAREDEANFMAFLICIESDDDYIRYSGYLSMLEYVLNALYSADTTLYYKVSDNIDIRVKYEMIAYNDFYEKYKKNIVSEVSSAVNDTFLKSQGQTEGTKSYGRVVDLAVAYYIP